MMKKKPFHTKTMKPVTMKDLPSEVIHSLRRGEYALRQEYFYFLLSISTEMGIQPILDVFASKDFHFLPRFYSMKDSAFRYDWSAEILFLHPPYGMMDKVVDKIFEEQCFGILLCAVESGARWFYKMQFISFYWIDLPNDVSILQLFSGT